MITNLDSFAAFMSILGVILCYDAYRNSYWKLLCIEGMFTITFIVTLVMKYV